MGAESVTVVNKLTTDTDLENPDYVIISDRSKPPSALCNNPKIVNVEYMKQCLVSAEFFCLQPYCGLICLVRFRADCRKSPSQKVLHQARSSASDTHESAMIF